MSSYDFIIDGIRFSYSSISTYDTCPWAFKLYYIDKLPGENNFFAQYGNVVHDCLEKFFGGGYETWELSDMYRTKFELDITEPPPPYPAGMKERYYEAGEKFFDNFDFDLMRYRVVSVENKINLDLQGNTFTGKPDLLVFDRKRKRYVLYDYKTSNPFRKSGNKLVVSDQSKIDGYSKQLSLYAYAIQKEEGLDIKDFVLWFTRANKQLVIPRTKELEESSLKWASETIAKIRKDEEFKYNNSQEYFCNNICSVRKFCEYR